MNMTDLRRLADTHQDRGSLPVDCILAICMKESSCREWAIKYEAHYKWLVGDRASMPVAEKLGQQHSWGLMQVMGAVAREYGHTGPFTDLWEPTVGLKYGMLLLHRLWQKYQNWPDVLASYNAGRPVRINGKYVNQAYVDAVLRYWNDIEQHVPLKETEA